MKYIKDLPHAQFKIGLYQWNGKYIIKIEAGGFYEQTYKLEETDLPSDSSVEVILDAEFMKSVARRFDLMHQDFQSSLLRNGIVF